MAAIDHSKEADYKAAKAKAQAEYKEATAKCKSVRPKPFGCWRISGGSGRKHWRKPRLGKQQ